MAELIVRIDAEDREGSVPGEFRCTATVSNEGDAAVAFNATQAAHPSLVLEVRDEGGTEVLLPPPTAPDEADLARGEPIEPGQSVTIEYAGFLDRSLEAGVYQVRYVSRQEATGGGDEALTSDWLDFVVTRPVKEFPRAEPLPEVNVRDWTMTPIIVLIRDWWRRFVCFILRRFGFVTCERVLTREVDEARTETISNAPAGAEAWNGTYGWNARFQLTIDEARCTATVTVRIRINGTITTAQRNAWEQGIENAWNNRFKLCCTCCCCPDGYRVVFDVRFVASGEHHVVNAGATTTNMSNWGVNDTVDVGHEFGHMLGALDEYFTVNGVDFGPGRQANGNIMNNPANPPEAHHIELVQTAARAELGGTVTTKGATEKC